MYYFACGSNLDKKQMRQRCPESKPEFVATLHHYKLVFVGWARQWRGGMATIKPARGEKVTGGIYSLSERDWRRLDRFEGYPESYDKIKVKVNNEFGDVVEALTYLKKGQEEETAPSKEYLAVMRQGYKDWGIDELEL